MSERAGDRAAELCQRYAAAKVLLSTGERATGKGGGLTAAVDRLGVRPLADQLADGEGVLLEDEGVSLQVRRDGPDEAVLRVAWVDGPAFEERVTVGPASSRGSAPMAASADPVAAPVAPSPAEASPAATGVPVQDLSTALMDLALPLWVGRTQVTRDGPGLETPLAMVPAVPVSSLGSAAFCRAHGVRAAYVAGAMAGGIASEELVLAMSAAGLMSCFGSGGLDLERVEQALWRISSEAGDGPFGFNLLHNPLEPSVEERTVDLYLRHKVRTVSASAYMRLTPAVVRYRLHGIRREGGGIVTDQHVMAKVSRPEVAEQFLRPASAQILRELVEAGHLTADQARLAEGLPVAEDITVEADSGGHTDRRPLVAMFPVIRRLRDRISAELGYRDRPRVGAGGGLGDPSSVHAALSMGADYVLTGSVNQASVEAGTSDVAKQMLAEAGIADCTTGPAPDMFELGAHVQVLARGTMWARRGQKLYELYRSVDGLHAIPADERKKLEKQIFRRDLDAVWADTRAFWETRDPREVEKADADPRHKMALTFRWYLGMASRWARTGDVDRKRDYQIWCGPSMGLFNDWVAGSWLEPLEARGVVAIADALLHGAAVLARADVLRAAGRIVPTEVDPPGPWRA